jgi:hypothetical protein
MPPLVSGPVVSRIGRVVKFGRGATKQFVHYGASLPIFLTSKAAMRPTRAEVTLAWRSFSGPPELRAVSHVMQRKDFDALLVPAVSSVTLLGKTDSSRQLALWAYLDGTD